MTDIEDLIAASSLGTPGAVALRAQASDEVVRRIVARSKEAAPDGMCGLCHGEPATEERGTWRLCGECAEGHDYYEALTADELALDRLAQALHVEEQTATAEQERL